jgi:hypothetical protein
MKLVPPHSRASNGVVGGGGHKNKFNCVDKCNIDRVKCPFKSLG